MSTFYRSGWPVSSRRWEERLQGREFVREEPPSCPASSNRPDHRNAGRQALREHARTMCHFANNVQLEALIMITTLKTEDSCQQVNDRSVIWNDSHLFCDITRLRLVIRKERAH